MADRQKIIRKFLNINGQQLITDGIGKDPNMIHPSSATTSSMEDKESKEKKQTKKKKKEQQQDQQLPTTQQQPSTTETALTSAHFKPSSEVKGLKFGGQFLIRSFTVRRAPSIELLRLLNLPVPQTQTPNYTPFPSTTTYLPTNFTILAHHAWHTLTLGLGTKKSKSIVFVFDSPSTRASVDRFWPNTVALGEVNRRLVRGLVGFEMARFKFRKGAITFYVFAVRKVGVLGFGCAEDLKVLLESMVKLKDFMDHTAMLAMPTQRSISFSPPVAMAH